MSRIAGPPDERRARVVAGETDGASSLIASVNLALRGVMELGVVAGFAWWGFHAGASAGTRALLAIGAPLVGFGFWGLVDFHQAGAAAEGLRLAQELMISGLAAAAIYVVGQHALGWTLAGISVVHHALVYLVGGRLLKR